MTENRQKSIFRKEAQERLSSPDDLDRYLQVTNPSAWVVLLAIAALVVGLGVWGVFGTVTTSVECGAVFEDGTVFGFVSVDDVSKVHEGDVAHVNGRETKVVSVSTIPYSRSEVGDRIKSEYLVKSIMLDDWGYEVVFEDVDRLVSGVPYKASITTRHVSPASLFFDESER